MALVFAAALRTMMARSTSVGAEESGSERSGSQLVPCAQPSPQELAELKAFFSTAIAAAASLTDNEYVAGKMRQVLQENWRRREWQ